MCWKMLVAAAWPGGQAGASSLADALCPHVQRAMAGLSPGLLSLEGAGGIRGLRAQLGLAGSEQ